MSIIEFTFLSGVVVTCMGGIGILCLFWFMLEALWKWAVLCGVLGVVLIFTGTGLTHSVINKLPQVKKCPTCNQRI